MNTLSFYRIKHLFASYFIANWRKELKTFLIVFAVNIFLVYLFHRNMGISLSIIFVMCLIYAGRIFGILGSNGAINYLALPANTSEKLLVNISLSHIYYPLALFAVSYLGILCGELFLTVFQYRPPIVSNSGLNSLNYNYIISLVTMISVFLFASVYFRKNAIAKLLFVFVVVFFVIMILFFTIGLQIIFPIFEFSITEVERGVYPVELFERYDLFFTISNYITILFFWVLSYFRLRETEA